MNIKKLTYLSFFLTLGIVIPQSFHILGGTGLGSIVLPMHIPVIIGGMLLGPLPGLIIGFLSVVIGFMLGMPSLPIAPFMLIELSVYGFVVGYLSFLKKINPYICLIITMVIGRLASSISMNIAIHLFGFNLPPVFGTITIFVMGIPGVIFQLIIIPPLVCLLRRVVKID